MKRIRFSRLTLMVAALALAVLLWLWLAPAPPTPAPVASDLPSPASVEATQEVTLYFAAPDEALLVAETRQLPSCSEEGECLTLVLEAWLSGPQGELEPVVPPGTRLREVTVEDGTARVDLSEELVRRHPGGSQTELLTVTALANTLAVNFPHVRQVHLRVEGEEPETLKGHLLLGQPIPADFRFIRTSATESREIPRGENRG